MMCGSDEIQAEVIQKIESAAELDARLKREQEYTHFKILGNVIRDYGMNRFGTRQARDAWKEATSDY